MGTDSFVAFVATHGPAESRKGDKGYCGPFYPAGSAAVLNSLPSTLGLDSFFALLFGARVEPRTRH